MDADTVMNAFKLAPAIVALLIVIYWQHGTITKLISGNQGDIERQTKMLALLEILVQRRANFRNDEGGSNGSSRGGD